MPWSSPMNLYLFTSHISLALYSQAYKAWPWQPIQQSCKPLPPKKITDKINKMQRKTTYSIDYTFHEVSESTVLRSANSADPDQTPRYAASDQGRQCLPIT